MKYFFISLFIVLTISLKAQFNNLGFNHISISSEVSFFSDNSGFENSLSDNGSHHVSDVGYGLGFSVPIYYPAEISAVTVDAFYDYRGNTNFQINTFMFCIGFDKRLVEREKYQLNMTGGAGSVFNYFKVNNIENIGNSSLDSLMLLQNSNINFKQAFQTFAYFVIKNIYVINDNISFFQSFDFRLQLAKEDLIRIHHYGVKQFDVLQADKYFNDYFEYFEIISQRPYSFESVNYIKEDYRHCA